MAIILLPCLAQAQSGQIISSANANFATLQNDMLTGGIILLNFTGTITMTSPITVANNTTLMAFGTNLPVLSGGGTSQMFIVPAGLSLTLSNLTLSGGKSAGSAGANGANGGTQAGGSQGKSGSSGGAGTDGLGGAIFNQGTTTAYACLFLTNSAVGGAGGTGGAAGVGTVTAGTGGNGGAGGRGLGGAILNAGTFRATNCSFVGNTTTGGLGGLAGLSVTNSTSVTGDSGTGGAGGVAEGAGFYNSNNCVAMIGGCTFNVNICQSGNSQNGSTSTGGDNGGNGISGPLAAGGAIFNLGTNSIVNCTFDQNLAVAGNGGNGGSTTSGIKGGVGGNGGTGIGGSLYNDSTGRTSITNCTFASGEAFGGTNGFGGTSPGSVTNSSGSPGASLGANIANNGGFLFFKNSILAFPTNALNASGTITDGTNNISSDASAHFTATNSFNSIISPGVSPTLAANGGPTLTLALNPGSPALDKIFDLSAPATDQRGITRPGNIRPDIGAYELGSGTTYTITGIVTTNGVGVPNVFVNGGSFFAFTASDGTFTLSGLTAGTYVLTPSLNNITFTPASASVTVPPSTTGVTFTGSNSTFIVSGNILISGGTTGFSGATVLLTGSNTVNNTTNYSAITDTNGNFAISNLFTGSYILAPQAVPGTTFSPSSSGFTLNSNFSTTFTVASVTNNIGVQINLGTGGFSNEPVALVGTNLFGTVIASTNTTSSSGALVFSNLLTGNYLVTPLAMTNASFSPSNAPVALPPGANLTFTGVVFPAFSISGTVSVGPNSSAYTNAVVVANGSNGFTTNTSYTTKTGNNGAYNFPGMPTGTYTVAPQPPAFFIPSSPSVVLTSNATANFVGVPPTIGITNLSGSNISLTLNGLPNVTYRIQSQTNLGTNWSTLTNMIPGSNGTAIISAPTNSSPNRFFRAVTP